MNAVGEKLGGHEQRATKLTIGIKWIVVAGPKVRNLTSSSVSSLYPSSQIWINCDLSGLITNTWKNYIRAQIVTN